MEFNTKIFRFHTSEEMVNYARDFRNKERLKNVHGNPNDSQLSLIAKGGITFFDTNEDWNYQVYGGQKFSEFEGLTIDEDALEKALDFMCEDKVREFYGPSILDSLFGGSTTLDFLVAGYQDQKGGWCVPSLEALKKVQMTRNVSSASDFHHCEVTIGLSSVQEIDQSIAFFNKHYSEDQASCPTNMVSFTTEGIIMMLDDGHELPHPGLEEISRLFRATDAGRTLGFRDKALSLPVKLLIGGSNWVLAIQFDCNVVTDEDGMYKYILMCSNIQPKLAEFLEDLPTMFGGGYARSDQKVFEEYIKILGRPQFKFKNGFVAADALAAFAGYQGTRTPTNMTMQLTGGIVLTQVHRIDQKWGSPFKDLPKVFQLYALSKVRSKHNQMVVLFAVLLGNIFPDPDVVLMITKTTQSQFVDWFGKFLVGHMKYLEVDKDTLDYAEGRSQLLLSLRLREPSSREDCVPGSSRDRPGLLRNTSPIKMREFADYLPADPSVVFGGPRFLHQVRFRVLRQLEFFSTICYIEVDWNIWQGKTLSKWDMDLVTYSQDLSGPGLKLYPGTAVPGLSAHPGLKISVAKFDPNTLFYKDLTVAGREQKRSPRLILQEFGRINGPVVVRTLLERSSVSNTQDSKRIRLWFPSLAKYEEVRVLLMNMTGSADVSHCEWAEQRINKFLGNAVLRTHDKVQKLELELAAARQSLDVLEDKARAGPSQKRVNMAVDLPANPSKKVRSEETKQNRREKNKRYKARKRARLSSDVDLQPVTVEVQETENTTSSGEVRTVTYLNSDLDTSEESIVLELSHTETFESPKKINQEASVEATASSTVESETVPEVQASDREEDIQCLGLVVNVQFSDPARPRAVYRRGRESVDDADCETTRHIKFIDGR